MHNRKILIKLLLISLFLFNFMGSAQVGYTWQDERPTTWAYDPGPDQDPNNSMARELIDLHADIPFYGELSETISNYRLNRSNKFGPYQKFRTPFGPVPWRMPLEPNTVKILFIGQDATHIAEAAARTATAGFGGRAQDLAAHFGVDYSAAFINTYAFTIYGQYAVSESPYLYNDKFRFTTFVPNDTWLYSQDSSSPLTQWRNNLIDWIIRNNKDSLKMIVVFGRAAKDSMGTFIEQNGGTVGVELQGLRDLNSDGFNDLEKNLKKEMVKIQVPYLIPTNAGGNNEFNVAYDAEGEDAYSKMLKKNINYSNQQDKNAIRNFLFQNSDEAKEKMYFTKAGTNKNGIIHPAQIGGYNLDQIYINKKRTLSLKGLALNDGSKIDNDILLTALPHPTFLSSKQMEFNENILKEKPIIKKLIQEFINDGKSPAQAFNLAKSEANKTKEGRDEIAAAYRDSLEEVSLIVRKDVKKLESYRDSLDWYITPDVGMKNKFAENIGYLYSRADIHNVYYDFGTPLNRQVSVSSAIRMDSQSIVVGDRSVPSNYDKSLLAQMKKSLPNQPLDSEQMFVSRARTLDTRYIFDPGPPVDFAKLMKELDYKKLYAKKNSTSKDDSVENLYIKSHPEVGDFAHYRGSFVNPRVFILADPDGFDDIITARALTGTRGQYLQGLMHNMGVGDQYLLLKTVPFGMDIAEDDDWDYVLKATENYRKNIITKVLSDLKPELIITDGQYAEKAWNSLKLNKGIPVFHISKNGLANDSGISTVAKAIKAKVKNFSKISTNIKMYNIPASHLTYYARVWEGTSGDRVITVLGSKHGTVFIEVAPNWAVTQKPSASESTALGIQKMLDKLSDLGLPRPEETVQQYIKRRQDQDKRTSRKAS